MHTIINSDSGVLQGQFYCLYIGSSSAHGPIPSLTSALPDPPIPSDDLLFAPRQPPSPRSHAHYLIMTASSPTLKHGSCHDRICSSGFGAWMLHFPSSSANCHPCLSYQDQTFPSFHHGRAIASLQEGKSRTSLSHHYDYLLYCANSRARVPISEDTSDGIQPGHDPGAAILCR